MGARGHRGHGGTGARGHRGHGGHGGTGARGAQGHGGTEARGHGGTGGTGVVSGPLTSPLWRGGNSSVRLAVMRDNQPAAGVCHALQTPWPRQPWRRTPGRGPRTPAGAEGTGCLGVRPPGDLFCPQTREAELWSGGRVTRDDRTAGFSDWSQGQRWDSEGVFRLLGWRFCLSPCLYPPRPFCLPHLSTGNPYSWGYKPPTS